MSAAPTAAYRSTEIDNNQSE